MATYFITGGNGFVGSHLVDRLVNAGHVVRALARDPNRPRFLRADGVEIVFGDLDDPDALAAGAAGADVVVHAAALTKANDEQTMLRVNVEGTRHVLDACLAPSTPPTLLFVSSQAAGGPSLDGRPVDERMPAHPCSSYGRSKRRAEEVLLEASSRLRVAIVRPPSVYGPRDGGFITLFRLARRGVLPLPWGSKHLSMIHVDDVVSGLLAAERGHGLYYVTDGQTHTLRSVLEQIREAAGGRAPIVRTPAPLFRGAIWCWERLASLSREIPAMTLDRARDALGNDWICSDRRAREELGYLPRWRLAEGLAQTAAWYREAGWLT